MGMFRNKYEGCSFSGEQVNPDPSKFKILDFDSFGPYLVLRIEYTTIPTTRFERIKIVVMHSTIRDLLNRDALDPHFSEDGTIIARFTPTDEGWADALAYARGKYEAQ